MEINIEGKKLIKLLIDNKILIPKMDDTLFVPNIVSFVITGNVLRVVPSNDAITFSFDREIYEENRPVYDKSLINKGTIDRFAKLRNEEKAKDIPDCTNHKSASEVKRVEIQKAIPKKKSIF